MNSQKQLVDNNEIKAAVHNQQVSTKNVPNKRDQEFLSIMTQVLENLNNNADVATIQMSHDVIKKKDSNLNSQSAKWQDLENLTLNSEILQNDANFATISEQVSDDAFSSIVERMEKHLFSKNTLYPLVKTMSDEYPAWFKDHKKALSPSDLERYTKQLKLIQEVCAVLEQEKENDTEDIKQYRFEHVKQLMTEIQNYGHVPEDLVKQTSSVTLLFQYDLEENLLPPEEISRQDCCIM